MKTKKVIVLHYDKKWAHEFEIIKKKLLEVLGNVVIAIEHVGSTSVEGVISKANH